MTREMVNMCILMSCFAFFSTVEVVLMILFRSNHPPRLMDLRFFWDLIFVGKKHPSLDTWNQRSIPSDGASSKLRPGDGAETSDRRADGFPFCNHSVVGSGGWFNPWVKMILPK